MQGSGIEASLETSALRYRNPGGSRLSHKGVVLWACAARSIGLNSFSKISVLTIEVQQQEDQAESAPEDWGR